MDELITILIIIGAIISFLSKLFRQSKEAKTEESPTPVAKPKLEEWMPPWLAESTSEQEFTIFETEPDTVPQPAKAAPEKLEATATKKFAPSAAVINKIQMASQTLPAITEIAELSFNLTSANEVRQGIVLAEILGPCKANRKRRRY
jgi:hypothetical protein